MLRKAIELEPNSARPFYYLGMALADQGKLDEAIAAYRKAIELDPKLAYAYRNLGAALADQGKPGEAIAAYRKAIELDPKNATAYYKLGIALAGQGKLDEAIAAYRKAIELDQTFASSYYNLGNALKNQGKLPSAVAAYRKTIELAPGYAEAHCNLGHVLLRQGHIAEGLTSLKRGHELGSKQPGWPYPSAEWVRNAERLALLERKLPAIQRGEARPADAAEQLDFARLFESKNQYAAAARFAAEAFAAQPALAEDLQSGHRYSAACYAVLAGCGQGKDAPARNDTERARLRQQGLDWLRADLRAWHKLLEKGADKDRPVVAQHIRHWLADADLSGVRDEKDLSALPQEEREAWRQLWRDVRDLLDRAGNQQQGKPTR